MGIRKEFQGKIRGSLEKIREQFYEEFWKNTMLSEFKRYNKIIIYSILFGSQKKYLYLCIVGQKEVQQKSEQQDIPRYTVVLV